MQTSCFVIILQVAKNRYTAFIMTHYGTAFVEDFWVQKLK